LILICIWSGGRYDKEILNPVSFDGEECGFFSGGNKDLEHSWATINSKEDKYGLLEEMRNGNRNSDHILPLAELVFI